MAKICCSIELEPRTLNQGQLDQAREVAVGVIQNKEPNEASNIFLEGIKPVAAIKEMAVLVVKGTNKLENEEDYFKEDNTCNINNEKAPCQCSINLRSSIIMDSPDHSNFKEPLSAPF